MDKMNWEVDSFDKSIKAVSKFIERELDNMHVSELRLFLADLIGMKRNEIMSAKKCSSSLGKQIYDLTSNLGRPVVTDLETPPADELRIECFVRLISATLDYLNADIAKAARVARLEAQFYKL